MQTGIYKITNIINQQCYIGISKNIFQRWHDHINNSFNNNCSEKNKTLYKAIKKYGINNFTFQIIEFCSVEELEQKEIQWIEYFDSYRNGYNETIGGDIGGFDKHGENHPNHKVTIQDVIDIRTRYNNKERRKVVWDNYKDKIGKSGFEKIWKGETWQNVMMDVYTEENKQYHKMNTGNSGISNGRNILTVEQVKDIRNRKSQGETITSVLEDYQNIVAKRYLYNIWNGYNWKDI